MGVHGYGIYVVVGLNGRDKHMLRLEISKLLDTELIRDGPNVSFSCRFMKMREGKL